MSNPAQTVHILGLGSIGSLIAHCLRSLPSPPPVNLLIHRKTLYDELAQAHWTLGLRVGEDGPLQKRGGFGAELVPATTSREPIQNLIVAVKASATVAALKPIQHRLGPTTNICLFQNGMGQVEDLNSCMFPDRKSRPTYMFGIMRHGVYLRSSTEAVLSGLSGSASIGIMDEDGEACRSSRQDECRGPGSPRELLDVLLRSPILRCEHLEWKELYENQLFKLAANCVLNPLTAIYDVRNGEIKSNLDMRPLLQNVLEEVSLVLQRLPGIRELPDDQKSRFSASALERLTMDTIEQTARNSSSMREDIRKGRMTEIEYINGWILRRARELQIDCPANRDLMERVLDISRSTRRG
ncbi:hypothetical protein N7539_002908 [Penicillium diatomitis]|uniref:2-dehydropantoate 2-reductase n=1 Tax=Penicillium diatomitis TaxID=2819901 RepID=A0A9W9XFS6_9EURO|nr:uncharacterized protein N7539_002908 [Penicillium diatomitis]KAJ5491341.1 hypothetical protein N7539_002908 [Penicillium diatomitis]